MSCNCNGKCKAGATGRRGAGGRAAGRRQFLALPWRLRRAVRYGRLTLDEASAIHASGVAYARSMLRETEVAPPSLEGETPAPAKRPPRGAGAAGSKAQPPRRSPCEPKAKCVTPRVSSGEFGTELVWFTDLHCVPAKAITDLMSSDTFTKVMVPALDRGYVAIHGLTFCKTGPGGAHIIHEYWRSDWKPDEAGVLTEGRFKGMGKRVLRIVPSTAGSMFLTPGSADNQSGADEIWLDWTAQGDTPRGRAEWITVIAHESAHAFHRLGRSGPAPKQIADRVRASITEEIETREAVRKILCEIDAKTKKRFLREIVGTSQPQRVAEEVARLSGSTRQADVERDPFPGLLKRTYLEEFVLANLMRDAIDREKLTASEIADIDGKVDALPLPPNSLDTYLARPYPMATDPPKRDPKWQQPRGEEYANFRFHRRVIDARWRRFEANAPADPGWREKAREAVLQQHASALFRGLINYTGPSTSSAKPGAAPCAPTKKVAPPPARKAAPAKKAPPRRGSAPAREVSPFAWAAEGELRARPFGPRTAGGGREGARAARLVKRSSPPVRLGTGAPAPAIAKKAPKFEREKALAARWPCDPETPRCFTAPSVSSGEFGRALLRYCDESCVPRVVIDRLKQSPTFAMIVCDLDARYLGWYGKAFCPTTGKDAGLWDSDWEEHLKPRLGVVTTKPHAGKRIISVDEDLTASFFEPAASLPRNLNLDIIHIESPAMPTGTPSQRTIVEWVARIAHECTHAWRLVTGTGAPAPGATAAARVRAAIRDEVETRQIELAIVAEIDRANGGRFLTGVGANADYTNPARVERDPFPGSAKRTYLEQFVLGHLMVAEIQQTVRQAEAKKKAKLTDAELAAITETFERIDKEVDAIPLPDNTLDKHLTNPFPMWFDSNNPDPKKRIFRGIPTEYGTLRFFSRVVDGRWKRLERASGPAGPSDAAREKVLQEHAAAFFRKVVAYTSLSAKPAPTSPARGTSSCWSGVGKAPPAASRR